MHRNKWRRDAAGSEKKYGAEKRQSGSKNHWPQKNFVEEQ